MIDFGWMTEPVWGGYGIAAACTAGLLLTAFWFAFGCWSVDGFPLRRKRRPIPINCRDCGATVASDQVVAHYAPRPGGTSSRCEANKMATDWVAQMRASAADKTPLTPHGEWQEYLHDAEFMDLDLFVEKWRDRKKPSRPIRVPVGSTSGSGYFGWDPKQFNDYSPYADALNAAKDKVAERIIKREENQAIIKWATENKVFLTICDKHKRACCPAFGPCPECYEEQKRGRLA